MVPVNVLPTFIGDKHIKLVSSLTDVVSVHLMLITVQDVDAKICKVISTLKIKQLNLLWSRSDISLIKKKNMYANYTSALLGIKWLHGIKNPAIRLWNCSLSKTKLVQGC